MIIKSNFRKNINEIELNKSFQKVLKDNWWHGVQHGIGLLSIVIPYAYKYRMKYIYIPSSYTIKDKNIRCASYPTIDENIKYGGGVIHEGFEYTRQKKIELIAKFLKETKNETLKLRVCWEGIDGENCSRCEKCIRTIVGLYLAEINPNKVGFNIKNNDIKNIIDTKQITFQVEFWNEIKEILKSSNLKKEKWINWLLELDIEQYNKNIRKRSIFFKVKREIKYFITKYFMKNNK